MARSIGPVGLNLIKEFEGLRLTAYKPVAAEQTLTSLGQPNHLILSYNKNMSWDVFSPALV